MCGSAAASYDPQRDNQARFDRAVNVLLSVQPMTALSGDVAHDRTYRFGAGAVQVGRCFQLLYYSRLRTIFSPKRNRLPTIDDYGPSSSTTVAFAMPPASHMVCRP